MPTLTQKGLTPGASERPLQGSWRWQQGEPAFHHLWEIQSETWRTCLWELALTSVLTKECHSPGASQIPNSHAVQQQSGHGTGRAKGLSDKEPGWNFHRLRLLGVVHTLPLAMPCALLRVLATSAYLSLAVQGPESLRPSSLLFSCHHWSLAFLSPKTGYEVEYSHPLLPPIPATLGGVEVQRATSLPL